MSDIEPISGPVGAAGDVPSGVAPAGDASRVDVAPVAATQVGGGGPAAPAPSPGRPKGLVRWGVALLALAVMVGVVSVAAVILAAGASSSAVQGWLPTSTVAYLELRADLPGDQRAKVGDIIAKFPGFADQSSLDAKIDEALGRILDASGVSWTADVKPWLGGEVGVAVTAAAFDLASGPSLEAGDLSVMGLSKAADDGAVLLVAVKDANAAKAWVSKQVGGTQTTETYAGGDITIVSGPLKTNVAFAVRGSVLILGPEKTVKASLDTAGNSPVPSSASFAAAREAAPTSYIGFGYVDLAAFAEAAAALAGSQANLPKACLAEVVGLLPPWTSGAMWASDDSLVFESTTPTTGEATSTTKGSASAIASHLPQTTVAAIEIRDMGPRLVDAVATLKKTLACDPATAGVVDQVEQALAAAGGLEALLGWADDTAIAVEFSGGTPGGGLAATVTDKAAAGRTLDQVKALLALAGVGSGIGVREEAYGDGQLLVITVPNEAAGTEVPEIAVTVQGDVFVLGTLDFVKGVVDTSAGSSLATLDTYKRAIEAAGGEGVSDVFVDITALRAAAETMIPAADKARYETEIKPFLMPFEAFASVAEAPAATTVSRAVITFTK